MSVSSFSLSKFMKLAILLWREYVGIEPTHEATNPKHWF